MIGKLLGALSYHVRNAEIEWQAENSLRQTHQYGWIRRVLVQAADSPVRSSLLLLLLFSLLSLIVYFHPVPRLPLIQLAVDEPTALSYLSTIWAIQATVVALVYPIVIAFVTLLIQRLHQGQSVLHIYLHDAAAVLSGSSALTLLFFLGLQYLLAPLTSVVVILNWAFLSGYWLILNIALATFFLYRTLDFLRPVNRMKTVKKYALNVAWPAEVERHLRVHIFDNAVRCGLLPGPAYPPDTNQSDATVLMGVSGNMLSDASTVVERQFEKEKALGDVLFRPLAWATASWLKRARQNTNHNVQQTLQPHATRDALQPVLMFPLNPDAPYAGSTTLCKQTSRLPISQKESLLIRHSFVFTNGYRDLDLNTQNILDDLKREATAAIRSNESQLFSRIVLDAQELVVSLIEGSSFTNEAGQVDNFSNLRHRSQVFHRPVYELWIRIWIELFQEASREIASNDEFVRKLIYVVPHMFLRLDGIATKEILFHLIDIQPILLSRLGDWWVRTLEQQGTLDHSPCDMASIRPPYSGIYESTIRRYVGAWETLKNQYILRSGREAEGWSYYQDIGVKFERHLQHSVTMLGECVYRGDKIASIWFSDVLLKWMSELEFYFDTGLHFNQRDKWVTFDLIEEEWNTVTTQLDIQADWPGYGNPKKSVLSVALHNYWTDVCCIFSYHLAIWGRNCDCQKSLPAILLNSLIHGQSLVGGAHAAKSKSPITNADELLLSILRQRYLHGGHRRGYRSRLDTLVKRLSNITEEVMVPGRIYGGVGMDELDSLQDGQLALLLLVAPKDWMPSKSVERLLTEWVRSDDERLRSLGQDLDQWKTALEAPSFEEYRNLFDCVSQDSDWTFDDALSTLRSSINRLSASVASIRADALDEIEISDARLRVVSAWASQTAFSQNTGAFPLPLFNAISVTTEHPFEQRSCVLRRVNKGEYTEPLMAQLPENEQEFFAGIVRNHVGQVLLRDSLYQLDLQNVQAPTPVRYWQHVRAYAQRVEDDGFRPILLLENRTRPNWVYEWLSGYPDSLEPPDDLEVWRDPQAHGSAYIANMNDVPVYLAPSLAPGCSVLMNVDSLQSVCFEEFTTGNKVFATAEPIEGETSVINLKLTWAYATQIERYRCLRLIYRDSASSAT